MSRKILPKSVLELEKFQLQGYIENIRIFSEPSSNTDKEVLITLNQMLESLQDIISAIEKHDELV